MTHLEKLDQAHTNNAVFPPAPPETNHQADVKATTTSPMSVYDSKLVARALRVMEKTLRVPGAPLSSPAVVHDFLKLKMGRMEREVFAVLFLDSQHQLIAYEEMFQGTLNQTAVYPREVAKRALLCNAAAVIFAHPHPSGVAEPSQADRRLTDALRAALRFFDIAVLDHIIVAGSRHYSFAEHGLL